MQSCFHNVLYATTSKHLVVLAGYFSQTKYCQIFSQVETGFAKCANPRMRSQDLGTGPCPTESCSAKQAQTIGLRSSSGFLNYFQAKSTLWLLPSLAFIWQPLEQTLAVGLCLVQRVLISAGGILAALG